MKVKCFCGEKRLDPEDATYVVDTRPCCSRECLDVALEAKEAGIANVVIVTFKREMPVVCRPDPGERPKRSVSIPIRVLH